MMKIHVCAECKYRALTSRRMECICRNCNKPMYKVDTVGFEVWWKLDEAERDNVIEEFLAKKDPA